MELNVYIAILEAIFDHRVEAMVPDQAPGADDVGIEVDLQGVHDAPPRLARFVTGWFCWRAENLSQNSRAGFDHPQKLPS